MRYDQEVRIGDKSFTTHAWHSFETNLQLAAVTTNDRHFYRTALFRPEDAPEFIVGGWNVSAKRDLPPMSVRLLTHFADKTRLPVEVAQVMLHRILLVRGGELEGALGRGKLPGIEHFGPDECAQVEVYGDGIFYGDDDVRVHLHGLRRAL